jgi:hypothetical protein
MTSGAQTAVFPLLSYILVLINSSSLTGYKANGVKHLLLWVFALYSYNIYTDMLHLSSHSGDDEDYCFLGYNAV